MALLAVLRRMGRGDLTSHGFRSTFRDWAAEETTFPGEVLEMALAHAIGNKVEAAYRRGDLFEKRRILMEAGPRCVTGQNNDQRLIKLSRGHSVGAASTGKTLSRWHVACNCSACCSPLSQNRCGAKTLAGSAVQRCPTNIDLVKVC